MIRIFSYDFEQMCSLKPLEELPARAAMIAPDVYRLPELAIGAPGGAVRTSGVDLVKLADWRGVSATPLHVKRQWQTYYNVRTLTP